MIVMEFCTAKSIDNTEHSLSFWTGKRCLARFNYAHPRFGLHIDILGVTLFSYFKKAQWQVEHETSLTPEMIEAWEKANPCPFK